MLRGLPGPPPSPRRERESGYFGVKMAKLQIENP